MAIERANRNDQARSQLLFVKRCGQVLGCPGFQRLNDVLTAGRLAHHDDIGRILAETVADAPAQLDAVHTCQGAVDEKEIGPLLEFDDAERFDSVCRSNNAESPFAK